MKNLTPWRSALLAWLLCSVINWPVFAIAFFVFSGPGLQFYLSENKFKITFYLGLMLAGFIYNLPMLFINQWLLKIIRKKNHWKRSAKILLLLVGNAFTLAIIISVVFIVSQQKIDLPIILGLILMDLIFTIINGVWIMILAKSLLISPKSQSDIIESDSPETY